MLDNPYKHIEPMQTVRKVYVKASEPEKIWEALVREDQDAMQELSDAMSQLVYEVGVPKWLVHLSANILYHMVYKHWGHYIDESDFLARRFSHMSPSLMAFLQRQYTLAHMGCSVVMAWDEDEQKMLCFRSLDWKGSNDIARATRIFSFVNKEGVEIAKIAGITAMLGVLTGVKEGFSVAINYAPWKRSARFKSDPTFLIRQLLEDESVNNYTDALDIIRRWEVGSPCFISLCGVQKGEACVIELGSRGEVYLRHMDESGILIQTNHYDLEASSFAQHNEAPYTKKEVEEMDEKQWYDSELLRNSQERERLLKQFMSAPSPLSMKEKFIQAYLKVPVLNWETAQWVLMQPEDSRMEVYTCIDK